MLDSEDYTLAFVVFTLVGFALLVLWLIEEVDAVCERREEILPPPSPLCRRLTGE